MPHTSFRRLFARILLAPVCLIYLVCSALPLTPPASGASPTPGRVYYECEGDACHAVALAWEEEGQRFRATNSSDRRARVEVETFAGTSAVVVEPHEAAYLEVKTFNGPYRAAFE